MVYVFLILTERGKKGQYRVGCVKGGAEVKREETGKVRAGGMSFSGGGGP